MLASALGIPNAKQVVEDSEKVMEIDDDTDLEEAAKFDLTALMEERGVTIGGLDLNDPVVKSLPTKIVQNKMREAFALPLAKKMS